MENEYFGRRVAIGSALMGLLGGLVFSLSHSSPVPGAFLGQWLELGGMFAAFAVVPVMLVCFAWNALDPHGAH